ncbi:MAG: extracellular solute-binding protein [Bacteroidales bacterium]|nr:extracellular solute-binding protein [Bacteroidales bacterium]
MKKITLIIVLVLAFTLTATALAADVRLKVEMSVYVEAPHKKAFDLLKEAYEAKHPNVEIVYYGVPYDVFWDKLLTEIIAGTEADIVQLQAGGTRYATYASLRVGPTGAFLNLDPYIKGTELEDKLIGQKDLVYNNYYIGISNYAVGMRAIYYRKSMFKEAGIDPDTIITNEDFLKAAKALTKKKDDGTMQYGFGAVISTHSFVFDEMKTFICRPIGATYTPLNQPPYEADNIIVGNDAWDFAFQWWQDMIFKDKVVAPGTYDKADQRDLFWTGTVAMNIDGPWFVGMTKEYDEALLDDLGVIASPDIIYKGKQYPFHKEIYGITHLISSNCKNPKEAVDFLLWMTTLEAQALVAECGMVPANVDYSTSDDYFAAWPWNAKLATLAEERYYAPAAFDPNIPEGGEISRIMIDAAQAAFIMGDEVTTTLDDAAEQIKDLFR